MNIIEPGTILNPATTKLVHCKSCDATWADRKIPKVCPHCGAGKSRLAGAKEEECESFMEAYNEMLASTSEAEEENTCEDEDGHVEMDAEMDNTSSNYEETDSSPTGGDQTAAYNSYDESADTYEPIGYDPDEFMNSMIQNCKIGVIERKSLLASAESRIKEIKWALQRAGLPTDSIHPVMQDIKSRADKLGKNLPGYTDLMLKMAVDNTLQQELRHPGKGIRYDRRDVNTMLRELEINEDYWESYYDVAGLAV